MFFCLGGGGFINHLSFISGDLLKSIYLSLILKKGISTIYKINFSIYKYILSSQKNIQFIVLTTTVQISCSQVCNVPQIL